MELQDIRDECHVDLIRALDEAVIYKHGPMCWSSLLARRHVRSFAANHPDIPVFEIDVVNQRPLSRHIAALLGVRHESPQVIILLSGRPVWDASHYRVTADALGSHLAHARTTRTG